MFQWRSCSKLVLGKYAVGRAITAQEFDENLRTSPDVSNEDMVQRTVGSHLRTVMIMLPAVLTPMFGLAASHSALAEELDELPNPAHASLVATGAPIYIGCFADCGSGSLGNRDLPHNAGNLANDTPVRCSLHLSFGDDVCKSTH